MEPGRNSSDDRHERQELKRDDRPQGLPGDGQSSSGEERDVLVGEECREPARQQQDVRQDLPPQSDLSPAHLTVQDGGQDDEEKGERDQVDQCNSKVEEVHRLHAEHPEPVVGSEQGDARGEGGIGCQDDQNREDPRLPDAAQLHPPTPGQAIAICHRGGTTPSDKVPGHEQQKRDDSNQDGPRGHLGREILREESGCRQPPAPRKVLEWKEGEGRQEGEYNRRPPPSHPGLTARRHRGLHKLREPGSSQEHRPDREQEEDHAEQRQQSPQLLPVPDLPPRRQRVATLQRLLEPVDCVPDGLAREVVARVRHRRLVENPSRPLIDGPVDPAGLDGFLRAEECPHPVSLSGLGGDRHPPHERGELVIPGEDDGHIARTRTGRPEGTRTLQHDGTIAFGIRRRRCEGSPAPHGVPLEADVPGIHDVERAKERQRRRASKSVRPAGRIGVSVARLIHRQHHVAPAGELDHESGLGFVRVDVSMDGHDPRRGRLRRRSRRNEEPPVLKDAVGTGNPDIHHPNPTAVRLNEPRQAPPCPDQGQRQQK